MARAPLGRLDALLLRTAGWGVGIALASHVAWLWLQAASMAGVPVLSALPVDGLARALTETQFGRVWALRLGALVLLGAFLLFRSGEETRRDWLALRFESLLLGGAALGALAWAGHAAATEGALQLAHLVADVVHLLVAGLWVGGLLPLAITLLTTRRDEPDGATRGENALLAARRFSTLALIAVAALLASGAVNTWVLVGDVARLIGTPYGVALLAKLVLLAVLLVVAAINRGRLAGRPRDMAQRLVALERGVVIELALGAVIVLVVGVLGVTPPARHAQPWWPLSFRLSWEATRDAPGMMLWLMGGGLFATLGAVTFLGAALRRFGRRWAVPLGLGMVGYGAWLALSPMAIDAYPTTYVRPTIPYAALSVANGRQIYREHCAVCHGVAGYGDGPGARGLAKPPADLTARHTADHTAGDLFWWLTHGIRGAPMPAFGDRLGEEERWDAINFLRTLASAEAARTLTPVSSPPAIVAPDFAFGVGVGSGATLKDHRGWAIVHLVLFTLPGSVERLADIDRAWGRLAESGARVLAVPMHDAETLYRTLGGRAPNLAVAVEGSDEIVDTYTMFRRTGTVPGEPPVPPHMEFLIDRQGYLRARWIPGEAGGGWADLSALIAEVQRLDRETPSAPAPDEHVH